MKHIIRDIKEARAIKAVSPYAGKAQNGKAYSLLFADHNIKEGDIIEFQEYKWEGSKRRRNRSKKRYDLAESIKTTTITVTGFGQEYLDYDTGKYVVRAYGDTKQTTEKI